MYDLTAMDVVRVYKVETLTPSSKYARGYSSGGGGATRQDGSSVM